MKWKRFSKNHTPKKILEISSYPPPRAGWGVRVSYVKQALIESGHVCEVLNISPFSRKIPSPEYLTTENGFDYVRKIISRRLKGYRIHMHMNGDSPKGFVLTFLALTISLLTFKRADLTFHAGPYQKYFPQERAPWLTPYYKYIFRVARRIICNQEAVKEKIVSYGINPDKVYCIQAFSVQYLQYRPVELSGKLAEFMERHQPLISTYVFFRPEFFIDRMMQAMARLIKKHPRLGLVILGSEANSQDIKSLIQQLDIEENIFFAGDQPHDAFLTIISRSDLYLRTPVKDGVCSSVLEALSLGVPVVASENHRRPESVITYDNENLDNMVQVLDETIRRLPEVRQKIVKPFIRDTVKDELEVLTT